ncbi:MAG: HAD-IB family hydrolase [Desulfarculus sp.]|nr:HAD-IB family hydrolase [Pseudomonadota bacterium]MBV1717395.1 HAD-IB family hydrolase [Desulfarculus sp.]MBU4573716.1 HAD-IB family hydrolase [Pseudomonadota bacterium]MBU4598694.1 HAD-IB family hydrolase [Pseudomonadota bacterium]MBV1739965.1 HAD-IB family hydrolase [Desulfarculus sp.]
MSGQPAAIFDVDRTLVVPSSMEKVFVPFLIRRGYLRAPDLARYVLLYLARGLGGDSSAAQNKAHLQGKDPGELERLAAECFRIKILPRISAEGRRRLDDHRRKGHLVVLLTGSLEPLAAQIQQEMGADLALAARLEVKNGALSGELEGRRPYGAEKARLVRELAQTNGLNLDDSYAYGDHHSDYDLLDAVGHPHAVNPDHQLRRRATERGWPILQF